MLALCVSADYICTFHKMRYEMLSFRSVGKDEERILFWVQISEFLDQSSVSLLLHLLLLQMSEFLYDMYVNVHADILIWQLLLNN